MTSLTTIAPGARSAGIFGQQVGQMSSVGRSLATSGTSGAATSMAVSSMSGWVSSIASATSLSVAGPSLPSISSVASGSASSASTAQRSPTHASAAASTAASTASFTSFAVSAAVSLGGTVSFGTSAAASFGAVVSWGAATPSATVESVGGAPASATGAGASSPPQAAADAARMATATAHAALAGGRRRRRRVGGTGRLDAQWAVGIGMSNIRTSSRSEVGHERTGCGWRRATALRWPRLRRWALAVWRAPSTQWSCRALHAKLRAASERNPSVEGKVEMPVSARPAPPPLPARGHGTVAGPVALAWALAVSACLPPPRDNTPLPDTSSKPDSARTDAGSGDATGHNDGVTLGDTAAKNDSALDGDTANADTAGAEATGSPADAATDATGTGALGGCKTDDQCATLPAPPCQGWVCTTATGLCALEATGGGPCPGDACSVESKCLQGSCVGKAPACDDKNPCTSDTCALPAGCVHAPVAAPCDDGFKCTTDDQCSTGLCAGVARICPDKGCAAGACNPLTGSCNNTKPMPQGTPCSVDVPCGGSGVCGGASTACAAPLPCQDANPCTLDKCQQGACVHYALAPGADCKLATGKDDPCAPGKCELDPAGLPACVTQVKCDDENPCTSDSCGSTGTCSTKPIELAANVACNDADPCTGGELCNKGKCTCTGVLSCTKATCNDGNPCTKDACQQSVGCVATPNSASCSDGSACTTGDACQAGKCAGTTVACDDGNACTTDACAPTQGCTHPPLGEGKNCGDGKTCAGGVCKTP
ncbi:MAG: hypothetical protein EXR79_05260 [Myxococcales bacterium]|nr:hypothetical protein [Myxococcales bacterium]